MSGLKACILLLSFFVLRFRNNLQVLVSGLIIE
jgi:hypothetical protein